MHHYHNSEYRPAIHNSQSILYHIKIQQIALCGKFLFKRAEQIRVLQCLDRTI